jgi:SOS-response transcriptional repressor LexA
MDNRQIRYLNARLLIARESNGELIRFAERVGKSQPQTSAFAGENPTKGIGPKIARQIDAAFNKERGWLDLPHYEEWQKVGLWRPEARIDRGVREPRIKYVTLLSNAHAVAIRHIPIISWEAAGQMCEGIDVLDADSIDEWVFTAATKAGARSYALRVLGDAMASPYPAGPSYPHGTIIIVDVDRPLELGNRVIAKRSGDDVTFKVYTEDGGRRLLKPLNPQYPVVEMTEDFHICGVVIGRGGHRPLDGRLNDTIIIIWNTFQGGRSPLRTFTFEVIIR